MQSAVNISLPLYKMASTKEMINILPVTLLCCGMEICIMPINVSRKEQKHFQPTRFYSSIIMTYSTFGLEYILYKCKYRVPIFFSSDEVLTN